MSDEEEQGREMHPDDDPYVLQGPQPHAFWAESVAERILERVEDDPDRDPDSPIVIKGGISPSGVPHLGNMNEIVRGYFVAEALRDRDHEVRQVFTADDRDPLRKLPRKLADLDGNVVELGDVNAGALGRNLGKPYTSIPDPFGCCDSYGEHFSNLIERSAELLGVPVETVSNTELYESGEFEDVTRYLLEHREEARELLSHYQDKVDEEYVPFNPICEECGKITETITAVNLGGTPDETTVEYVCTDMEAGDRTIEGCGHEGTATLREGKLPWRFEWPAQWQVLGVDHEPFGKDHAEGSWPSGADVARNVLGVEPPVPMAYEWFTLDGEAFSSSSGHVVMVQDVLELLDPEALRYFFTKDPSKARDFSVEHLDQLVDEFDEVERDYYGEAGSGDGAGADDRIENDGETGDDEGARTDRTTAEIAAAAYPPTIRPTVAARFDADGEPISDPDSASVPLADDAARVRATELVDGEFRERVRLPYTFAAVLGMTDDPDLREEIARREGHVPDDAPEWAIGFALSRVERAREWARRTGNEFDYELKRTEMPAVDLDAETEVALDELADFVATHDDPEAIQGEIYETAKRHDIPIGEFFSVGYRLFFDDDEGPKLGPFLARLDEEFVLMRLRREG